MAQPPTAPRNPTWIRVLLGCAVVLGAFLLVGLGLLAYGFYWFFSPGPQMPAATVVGPDSVGVIRLDDARRDPGMRALLGKLMVELQRAQSSAQRGQAPPGLEWIQAWQMAQMRNGVDAWLPREAVVSLERPPSGEEARMVAAVNLRRLVRPIGMAMRWALQKDPRATSTSYQGHPILVLPNGPAFCFAGGTVLVAGRRDALTGTLDRLARPPRERHRLVAGLDPFAGHWDLYGTLARPLEAQLFVDTVLQAAMGSAGEEEEAPAGFSVDRATFALDVVSADEARWLLRAGFPSAADAESARPGFETLLEQAREGVAIRGLELRSTTRPEGTELVLEGSLRGMAGAIERWSQAMGREIAQPPNPRRTAPASP